MQSNTSGKTYYSLIEGRLVQMQEPQPATYTSPVVKTNPVANRMFIPDRYRSKEPQQAFESAPRFVPTAYSNSMALPAPSRLVDATPIMDEQEAAEYAEFKANKRRQEGKKVEEKPKAESTLTKLYNAYDTARNLLSSTGISFPTFNLKDLGVPTAEDDDDKPAAGSSRKRKASDAAPMRMVKVKAAVSDEEDEIEVLVSKSDWNQLVSCIEELEGPQMRHYHCPTTAVMIKNQRSDLDTLLKERPNLCLKAPVFNSMLQAHKERWGFPIFAIFMCEPALKADHTGYYNNTPQVKKLYKTFIRQMGFPKGYDGDDTIMRKVRAVAMAKKK